MSCSVSQGSPNLADRKPDAILFGDGLLFNEMVNTEMPFRAHNVRLENFAQPWRHGMRWCQPSTYFPRNLYEQIGPLNIQYNFIFDREWMRRALQTAPIYCYRRTISRIRLHPTSKTVAESSFKQREERAISKNYWPKEIRSDARLTEAIFEMIQASGYLQDYCLDRKKAGHHLLRGFKYSPRIIKFLRYWILWIKLLAPRGIIQLVRRIWWRF